MYCHRQTDEESIKFDQKNQKTIQDNWQLFIERRPTKEVATLCRFLEVEGDKIVIATDVTYKDVVGLRWRNLITHDCAVFQVVTAIAIVKTSDKHMILIPRDSGDWEPSLECPGGFIRSSYFEDERLSVTDFIKKRVCEDLHINAKQIATCNYLTTYDAKEILEYMLVYEITLNLTKEELLAQHPSFTVVPPEYTPETHPAYSNGLLHVPSNGAMLAIKKSRA